MKIPCLRSLLPVALTCFLLAAGGSLMLHRHARHTRLATEERTRLLRSLAPEIQRLERYEAVGQALLAVQRGGLALPTPPPGSARPETREVKRQPPAGGWRAVQLAMAWPRLKTDDALRLAAYYATNQPAWRISELQIDALDEPGQCRLSLMIESVEPASADGDLPAP